MIHSLRLRMLLVAAIISGISISAVSLLSSRATSVEFNRYVQAQSDDGTRLDRAVELLANHYRDGGTWKGVEPVLERIGREASKRLVLFGNNRQVVASWPDAVSSASLVTSPVHRLDLTFKRVEKKPAASPDTPRLVETGEAQIELINPSHVIINVPKGNGPEGTDSGGSEVGSLYLLPLGPERESTDEEVFVGSVNRSLVAAALVAGVAALLLTVLLSGRILGPVERLTEAVRHLERGDLTRKVEVRSKDEIGELAHAFNVMAASLRKNEGLRRNMVSDIAHELRTPLTNIRCQIEALQDGLVKPGRDTLDSLHEETMLLNRLVEDLQELALAEAGQLAFRREPVSMMEAFDQAATACEPLARVKRIAIEIAAPDDLTRVYADSLRVGQILRNLISNALKHTPEGGRIRLAASERGSSVEVTVEDTGTGIEPEHLPYVFERFYRTDRARARATGGAGLGLAIVKQLVLAHGGEIRAESPNRAGSRFVFTLPAFIKSS